MTARLATCLGIFSLFATAGAAEPKLDTAQLIKTFHNEFVAITPGSGKFPASFLMGSAGPANEKPAHKVELKQPFRIAKYEVPQNLYEAIMGNNPSRWKGPRNSVEMMTRRDALAFCETATTLLREAKLIAADEVVRLPSEAEWEYCCRAGTTTAYSFGDAATKDGEEGNKASLLDEFAWHTGNAAGNDPPVGAKKPNAWGLYDLHGYLWELTADDWHDDYTNAPADGRPWTTGKADAPHPARGGSWKDNHRRLTSSARVKLAADAKDDALGFRCVLAKIAK